MPKHYTDADFNYQTDVADKIGILNKRADWVSVKEFGAKGDGVTDDTTAIQNALNTSRVIYFPRGIYRVTDTLQFTFSTVLRGADFSIEANSENTSLIFFDSQINNKPLFTSSVPNHKIIGLQFKGVNFGTDRRLWSKCFVFNKGTVYGDTDVEIRNCHFKRFSLVIEFEGRGLHVSDCTFEEIWNGIQLKHFNNDETANPPTYDFQTNIRGFRKFHFVNNVFHSTQGHAVVCESTSPNNYEKYIHQVVFTGNRHDGTGGLWKGYLGGGVISGNTLGKSSSSVYGTDIHTFDLASLQNVSITGNVFAGEYDMSTILGKKYCLGDVFYFRSNGDFKNINISNNTFIGVGKKLINAQSSVFRLNFCENVVDGVLMEQTAATDYPFYFSQLGKTIKIKNNIIKNTNGVKRDYMVYFEQRGILEYQINDNIFDPAEFGVTHNLYPWNASGNFKLFNYTGDGTTSQTFTFAQPVNYVMIADYTNNKTYIKRSGTTSGDSLISILDNTVTVKGNCNISGVTYSTVIVFV